MERPLPDVLNVLLFARASTRLEERVRAIAPGRLNVVSVWEDFMEEMRPDWPPAAFERYARGVMPQRSREEKEALLAGAHVALLATLPYPRSLAPRLPNLLWVHLAFAGVGDLKDSSWWGGPFLLTSGRGYTAALPIAESLLAGVYMLAKRFDKAALNSAAANFDAAAYGPMQLVSGKTLAIIGLGGIGGHTARIARGSGMRVIATRRSALTRSRDVDGVDELFPPAELKAMLAEADFVAVCVMRTAETERMLDRAAFEAMKPGAFLLNIARGEIVEEAALVEALHSGHLGGAYLDVWENDSAGSNAPSAALRGAPNVIFTPHISNRSDTPQSFGVDVFCDNLARLLQGEPLINVVDWQRGY